jgi:hypothetical protein
MIDKHRNSDGTYNGIGVLSDMSGLSRDEVRTIAERVKANHARLAACLRHDFDQIAPEATGLRRRFRCRHCGGEIDSTAYHWHEVGRRGHQ